MKIYYKLIRFYILLINYIAITQLFYNELEKSIVGTSTVSREFYKSIPGRSFAITIIILEYLSK